MIIERQADVTTAVLDAMDRTADRRLREITQALVRHLHAFVREVRPSEREFEQGLEFLNRIGAATTATHNEGVLASDAFGVSTLVCLLNNGDGGVTETAAALLGPFWRDNSPVTPDGGSLVRGVTPGPRLFAAVRVVGPDGGPVAGARVDVWHSSPDGIYENQDPDAPHMNLRGRFTTGADGRFRFVSVKPAGYPVPTHGPIGDLLRAQDRHPYRPAHLHFLVYASGFRTLITQVFVDDDPYLDSDVVFGVTRALIGGYVRGEGPAPDGGTDADSAPHGGTEIGPAPHGGTEIGPAPHGGDAEWWSLDYTLHLQPGEARMPVPPIP